MSEHIKTEFEKMKAGEQFWNGDPEIGRIKSALLSCGACGAQMTGSGSAVFGIFASLAGAKDASAMLKESEFRVFVAKNVSH